VGKPVFDWNIADGIMREAEVLRIALCDEELPYIVPVNFGYDGKAIYIHSSPKSRKLEIIRKNPNAAFEVDLDVRITQAERPCEWSMKYKSVVGRGKAEIVEDENGKLAALKELTLHYKGKPENYNEAEVKHVAIIKITIENMAARIAS
jgi:hypothetical protein